MNPNQRQGNRQWENVNTWDNNPRLEPHKDPQFNDNNPWCLEGYYKSERQIDGDNGPFSVFTIVSMPQGPDGPMGETFDMAGGMVMEGAFEKINMNSYVRIEYYGKKPSKKPGKMFNDYRILVDNTVIPYNQRPDVLNSMQNAPQQQRQNNAPAQNYGQNVGPAQNNQQQGYGNQNAGQNQNWSNQNVNTGGQHGQNQNSQQPFKSNQSQVNGGNNRGAANGTGNPNGNANGGGNQNWGNQGGWGNQNNAQNQGNQNNPFYNPNQPQNDDDVPY